MIDLQLQNELNLPRIPSSEQFEAWVISALQKDYPQLEQLIRIVDDKEIQALNKQYRDQDKATNILSFPAEQYDFLDYDCLGDLVVCASVVEQEAKAQDKTLEQHWAHLIVHGILHLQGFDHLNDDEANEMECLEIKILEAMGIVNPYNARHDE